MIEKIALLMATYNGQLYIEEQINSILDQSDRDWVLYISDDGSTDNTKKIVYDYAKDYPESIIVLDNEKKNLGSARRFIYLLENVCEKYYMFCDQDDIWMGDKIKNARFTMHEMEDRYSRNTPLLAFSDLYVVDENLNCIHNSFHSMQKLDLTALKSLNRTIAHNVVTGCTTIFNDKLKEMFVEKPEFEVYHDHLLAIFAVKNGQVKLMDSKDILYRQHYNNTLGAQSYSIKYFLFKIMNTKQILNNLKSLISYLDLGARQLYCVIFVKVVIQFKRLIF